MQTASQSSLNQDKRQTVDDQLLGEVDCGDKLALFMIAEKSAEGIHGSVALTLIAVFHVHAKAQL